MELVLQHFGADETRWPLLGQPGAYLAEATHRAIATPDTVTLPSALRTP